MEEYESPFEEAKEDFRLGFYKNPYRKVSEFDKWQQWEEGYAYMDKGRTRCGLLVILFTLIIFAAFIAVCVIGANYD